MLTITDHYFCNADLARPTERLMQNRLRFFATLLRLQEIWLVKKLRIDLFQIDEIRDVDRMRGFDPHLLEVLVFHYNVAATLVLKAPYDLVGRNLFRICFRDLFVFDWTKITGTKLPETKLLLARGRIKRHGNIDEPEADTAFPNGTHGVRILFFTQEPDHVNLPAGCVARAWGCRIALQVRETA